MNNDEFNDDSDLDEDFDLGDFVPQLRAAGTQPPEPEATDYTTDEEFRKRHPLALRALVGGIDVPRGVRSYGLVAVENPTNRPWIYEHTTGLPPDAFAISRDGQRQPCKYKSSDLRIRFRWEAGETKLVPTLILHGLWQIRDGEIIGGGGIELRLARGETPPIEATMNGIVQEQNKRGAPKRVRS